MNANAIYNAASLGVADIARQKLLKKSEYKGKETLEVIVSDYVSAMTILQPIQVQAAKLTGENIISGLLAKALGTMVVMEAAQALGLATERKWSKDLMITGTDYVAQYGVNALWGMVPGLPANGTVANQPSY